MATVIDELVVRLGLDSKGFSRGRKQVESELDSTKKSAEKTGKEVEASGKRAAEFFGQMERAAIKFFGVLTVGRGLSDFSRVVIQSGAQLDRFSTRLGESAAGISRWQGAVRQSGGSAEGLLSTLQALSQQFTQLKETGDAPIRLLLQQLGVSAVDNATGKAKPLLKLLQDIGEALDQKGWANSDKFNKLLSVGIDEGTANFLLRGSQERKQLLADQREYSDADARAAREASERWEKTKLQIERISQELVIKLLPSMERLAQSMVKFAERAVPVLSTAVDWFVKLDDATNGWATTLGIALATLRVIGGPGIASGIAGLTGSLTRLAGVGAAAYGGYEAGSYISRNYVEPNRDLSDKIGGTIATILAGLGNEQAQRALENQFPGFDAGGGFSVIDTKPGSGLTRAQRNNNPGNLEFRGQAGAVPEAGEGRFAKFGSMGEGVAALVRQLQLYGKRGLNTLNKIINTYAPDNENDTAAYIANLSKMLGVGAGQQLDLNDANTLAGLVRGISQHESGKSVLTDQDVLTGLQLAGVRGGGGAGNNISIGQVTINTQATDATGIARDFNTALIRQADSGMR